MLLAQYVLVLQGRKKRNRKSKYLGPAAVPTEKVTECKMSHENCNRYLDDLQIPCFIKIITKKLILFVHMLAPGDGGTGGESGTGNRTGSEAPENRRKDNNQRRGKAGEILTEIINNNDK
jgi:hypothetical protein